LALAPYPLLRLAVCLSMGIACYVQCSLTFTLITWLFGTATIACLLSYFCLRSYLGLLLHCFCFSLGLLLCHLHTDRHQEGHFSHQHNITAYLAKVDDEAVVKKKSVSVKLKVTGVKTNGQWRAAQGQVLTYFPLDTDPKCLEYGNLMVIKGQPSHTEAPKNRGEFDYKRFLTFQNIGEQHFIAADRFAILAQHPDSKMWQYAFAARKALLGVLEETLGNTQEKAVASMLVLGIRQSIDPDLFDAYSGAGAVHVLAVSGLHVGIIFGLLQFLFARLSQKGISYAICLVGIWSFGFLTAFSPSVLRAVVMFSIVIVGKWMGRKGNLFNTLGATALLILFFAPFMLMNVGFQMSFLAVFGIAYFQPRIQPLFQAKHVAIGWLWEITSLSISAQITTFPLALLYFKQFPTYFLLSNLWVVPMSTLILYLGIVFYLGAFWPVWKMACGFLLKTSVVILNQSIFWVTKLPYSVQRTMRFDDWETVAAYLLIIALALVFYLKSKKPLFYALGLALTLSASRIYKYHQVSEKHELVFYSLGKETCIGFVHGTKARLLAKSQVFENSSSIKFHVLNPLMAEGITEIGADTLKDWPVLITYKQIHVALSTKVHDFTKRKQSQDTDILYVENACMNQDDFVALNKVKHLILPRQNCHLPKQMQARTWNLHRNGAFVTTL
jgi:competence protein ComEC